MIGDDYHDVRSGQYQAIDMRAKSAVESWGWFVMWIVLAISLVILIWGP